MATLVQEALSRSMRALSEPNRKLAYAVILRHQRIAEVVEEIDSLCLEFLAREQPTAKSLRFAYAAIKINSALERAGNCAESIARQILVLCSLHMKPPQKPFEEIADLVIPMLTNAFTAFVAEAPDKARLVMQEEEKVDRLRHQLGIQLVMTHQSNESPDKEFSPLITVLNRLERTADQARDICQEVIYLYTEEYLKHPSGDVFRVLFVDDDNSCASQMAEAIGNSLGQSQFVFWSAGLHRKAIDAGVVEYLKDHGLNISERNSKAVTQVPHMEHFQVIVALSEAARSALPAPPTKAVCLDWSAVNVAKSPNSAEQRLQNYSELHDYLFENVRDLVGAAVSDQVH
jgi:phosphate transport system protein